MKKYLIIGAITVVVVVTYLLLETNESPTDLTDESPVVLDTQPPAAPADSYEEPALEINQHQTITADQAAQMMLADENIIILDVRTAAEFAAGHIENAILMPAGEIQERLGSTLPDKTATILIYCFSGNRSANVASELAAMGYLHVYDFGGISSWEGEIVK